MGVSKKEEDIFEGTLAEISEAKQSCSHQPGSEGKIRILQIRAEHKLPMSVLGDEKIPIHPKNKLQEKKKLELIVEDNSEDDYF